MNAPFASTEGADDFMRRKLALDAAEEQVTKTFAPPMNARGYPVDGWKPPTHEERTTAVLRIAAFLLGEKP